MLINDLKRAVFGTPMLLSVGVGIISIAVGMIVVPIIAAIGLYYDDAPDITDVQKWELIYNCLNKATLWVFGNVYYFPVIPLMCSIPFSIAYIRDLESGYNRLQIIRTSYRKYLLSKYFATFSSGFLAVMVVCLVNLSLIMLVSQGDEYRSIFFDGAFLGDLARSHFHLFVLCHGAIVALLGGVYAIMGLTAAKISKNILVGLAFPFLFHNFLDYVTSTGNLYRMSPSAVTTFYMYMESEIVIHPIDIIGQLSVLLLIVTLGFVLRTYWSNNDEYV